MGRTFRWIKRKLGIRSSGEELAAQMDTLLTEIMPTINLIAQQLDTTVDTDPTEPQ